MIQDAALFGNSGNVVIGERQKHDDFKAPVLSGPLVLALGDLPVLVQPLARCNWLHGVRLPKRWTRARKRRRTTTVVQAAMHVQEPAVWQTGLARVELRRMYEVVQGSKRC